MTHYQLKSDFFSSHQQIFRFIAQLQPSAKKILDLGCDVGFLGRILHKQSNRFIIDGVDVNPKRLALARKYYNQTYCFDLNQPHWRIRKKYDVVVVADTLEHLINPAAILRKCIKLIKTGGYIILSVPNIGHWWPRLMIVTGNFPLDERRIFDKTHMHFYTLDTINRFLGSFPKLESVAYLTTTPPLQFIFQRYGRYLPLDTATRVAHKLSQLWPKLFTYQHIFVIKKGKFD